MARAGLGDDLLLANEVVDVAGSRAWCGRGAPDRRRGLRRDHRGGGGGRGRRGRRGRERRACPAAAAPPSAAGRLADSARRRGLAVRGVMGYEGHVVGVEDRGQAGRAARARHGHVARGPRQTSAASVVSAGGTGTYDLNTWATEIQAGSYALMDSAYGRLGPALPPGAHRALDGDVGVAGMGRRRLRG